MKQTISRIGFNTIGELQNGLAMLANDGYDIRDSAVTDFAGVEYTTLLVVEETLSDGSTVLNVSLGARKL